MPELPETETIARDLARDVRHQRISAVRVIREDVLSRSAVEPQVMRGLTIENVTRRAKTVVIELSRGYSVLVTPRFTGKLLVRTDAAGEVAPYDVLHLLLADGRTLAYNDVRRLGTVRVVDLETRELWNRELGVEPLDAAFTFERLTGILRGTSQPIKKALMDQRRIAGIGNIYANEALWIAQIDPSRDASTLDGPMTLRLLEAIQNTLQAAVEARGTSFRDYRDAYGQRGGFSNSLQAYGRGGEPCTRCGTRLAETHAIDGRSTVFCFRCQQ